MHQMTTHGQKEFDTRPREGSVARDIQRDQEIGGLLEFIDMTDDSVEAVSEDDDGAVFACILPSFAQSFKSLLICRVQQVEDDCLVFPLIKGFDQQLITLREICSSL